MSQDKEEAVWIALEVLQREMRTSCDEGRGSPALREAAEAITDGPQAVLERERGRRQLRDEWCRLQRTSE
jgi:hypothetical protein